MRILKEGCLAVLIDVQEKLYPHMQDKERLLNKTLVLIQGLRLLDVPVIVTQQYSKGLGKTIGPVMNFLDTEKVIEKISFSCCDENSFKEELDKSDKNFIIIAGIESHICVLQTVIDLIAADYIPIVIEDCVSSRDENDKKIAIDRMRSEGAVISTCESILFELCQLAGTETFKNISRLVR